MPLKNDTLSRVLYVDLSKKSFQVQERPDLFDHYLGGAGVASRLLTEECPQGADPAAPENPIIFAVGPLTGLFPLASKTVAMFKSPHTGNLGESHAGGRSAVAIRMAGYGAIVIKGANPEPGYLAIHGDQVFFRDAATLWGMSSSSTASRIIRENEPGAGLRTIMRIGKAGEQLIPFACVTTETYRHFGRLGLGAVFGSKRLKAVVVSGRRKLPVVERKAYRDLYDGIYTEAVESPVMKKYHDLGTPENILPLNAFGGLPTRNLQQAHFESAEKISGEYLAQNYLGRRLACSHCPVGCIHIAALREPYEDEAFFYKTTMVGYDYELIYALASLLGGTDIPGFLQLINVIEALGLDAMSTGVALAWATEAFMQGLISQRDTGDLIFAWGDYPVYSEAVSRMVEGSNEFYQALARGVDYVASKYGGQEFALAWGGNEIPGYHTGPGAHLGFLLGARHSHLDNAGYSIDQKILTQQKLTPQELTDKLIEEESWRQILSSLVTCFFARGIYVPERVSAALACGGYDFNPEALKLLGREIWRQKFAFKFREGFSFEKVPMAARFFQTPSPTGTLDEAFFHQAIEYFKTKVQA